MSKLQEKLESGEFVFTGEVAPPKGTNVEPVLEAAEEHLKDTVVAVNVTDLQMAVMRAGSLALCIRLKEIGIEPVFQVVCRDRNRLALQSDLLNGSIFGIENVLALTGDHVAMGDHSQAKPVYDLDSVSLLQTMSTLEEGRDLGTDRKGQPNELDGAPTFFKGCCVTPGADEMEPQILKLEKKVAAGAQFVQTQAMYEPEIFEEFMNRIDHIDVPVIVGIVMLKSAGMVRYMNNNVPGVKVPDEFMERLSDVEKEDRPKVSVEIAGELIGKMKHMCQGAHLMTLGWDQYVPDIIEAAGL
ncbi:MAG: methylenetetrahydrofolate reductase [Planctomycetota bacterium]